VAGLDERAGGKKGGGKGSYPELSSCPEKPLPMTWVTSTKIKAQ